MKKLLPILQVLFLIPVLSEAQSTLSPTNTIAGYSQKNVLLRTPPDKNWENSAQQYLSRAEYFFKNIDSRQFVANRRQKISFSVEGNKISATPILFNEKDKFWNSSLELLRIDKGTQDVLPLTPTLTAFEGTLNYRYDGFNIEYINDESGLRQNFIVTQQPAGHEKLQVHLRSSGDLDAMIKDHSSLVMNDKKSGKTLLSYDGLKVWDANNKILNASMELSGDELIIKVDDENASYPVTIDPLTHSPEWVTSADGILPGLLTGLQLQVDALYAYSMAGVGDVNNDGYDDVAIGAPGAIDLIGPSTTIAGAGAVFLYFGSANGLPVIPSRTLRSTTPVLNALFGFSVAGGNVVGSVAAGNINSDVVVGAPGESYVATVGGTVTTASVTAGRVYVFNGANLTSGPSAPTIALYLNGAGFFNNLLNVNVNALFGFSVATTGDINGDGLSEFIVGAPGYQGVNLLDARSGAAFVYYSGTPLPTPVKLNPPTLLNLPGLTLLGGLLFGYSVDGAGDFSGDGRQDVIVGAPGGISLGVGSLLSGQAYIFQGNAGGTFNTTYSTQLVGSGPLLGSVANLFGFKVKGVTNAAGIRNGRVLVGAPSGSVLSSLTNGLRLKTGNIYVFGNNSTTPIQNFSSPRGANLLAQLLSLNIDVNALFGGSMDNMMDANCDGISDIIVGEPLSTGVGLIGVNAVGGAAYVFTGNADGSYNTTPFWMLENSVSFNAGINAGSLLGFSVAGGGHTSGRLKGVRAIVGAPGGALDFSSGILALGNTLGTLFSFVAGQNGLGKTYAFPLGCDVIIKPDMNVTQINVLVPGNVHTNDAVPTGTTYGTTPVPDPANPAGATIVMNADGTYTFVATTPGVYNYSVPVCIPAEACVNSTLTITVLSTNGALNPPVANTDIASTTVNTPVTVNSLANDAPGNVGGSLFPSSVTVVSAPSHGTASVNTVTGEITYTPATGYVGNDTLHYNVCDNSVPAPLCATAMQVFYVGGTGAVNTTMAADDFVQVGVGIVASGNVSVNDTDPEGNTQTVTAQNVTVPGKGTLILNADGSYSFTPVAGFSGPIEFTYNTCDNGSPSACAGATLHILVTQIVQADLTPTTRLANGTFLTSVPTTRDFVIEVNEITGNAADNIGAPIRVRITKSDNFNYTFNPTATTANVPASITVDNSSWTLISNTTTAMIFELNSSSNIAALGTSRISIIMQVLSAASPGTENQTVSIVNGSGREVNFNNNSVVRILNILN